MASTQARTAQSEKQASRKQVDDALRPIDDMVKYAKQYAREKPEYCALTCLAVGFVLGWKLKPW